MTAWAMLGEVVRQEMCLRFRASSVLCTRPHYDVDIARSVLARRPGDGDLAAPGCHGVVEDHGGVVVSVETPVPSDDLEAIAGVCNWLLGSATPCLDRRDRPLLDANCLKDVGVVAWFPASGHDVRSRFRPAPGWCRVLRIQYSHCQSIRWLLSPAQRR